MPLRGLFRVGIHQLVDMKVRKGVNLVLIGAHGAILARFAAQSEIGTCEIRPISGPKKAGRGVAE